MPAIGRVHAMRERHSSRTHSRAFEPRDATSMIVQCSTEEAMQGGSSYHATDGAAYERFLGRWSRRLAAPLLEFAEFTVDGCLLDVGCATGSVANALTGKWPARPIVGADIAAPSLSFARSQCSSDHAC